MFNALELEPDHNRVRVRELTADADSERPSQYHVGYTDSRDRGRTDHNGERVHLADEHPLVRDIVAAFEYVAPVMSGNGRYIVRDYPDGNHNVVRAVRIMAQDQFALSYVIEQWTVRGCRVMASQRLPAVLVHCLDDITAHPQVVQDVAALVFTDEVKAAAQPVMFKATAKRLIGFQQTTAPQQVAVVQDDDTVQVMEVTVPRYTPVFELLEVVDDKGEAVMVPEGTEPLVVKKRAAPLQGQ